MKDMIMKVENGIIMSNYTDPSLNWGFCTAPNSKGEFKLITQFGFCREGLTTYAFNHVAHKSPKNLSFMKARLLARIVLGDALNIDAIDRANKKFYGWMESGLNLVNILEAEHGWPLTHLYRVKHTQGNRLVVCMFIGSAKWVRSPATLSMFALLVRISNSRIFSSAKDHKSLMAATKGYSKGTARDCDHTHNTMKYWNLIMGDFAKLFSGFPAKGNFNFKNYGGASVSQEGLSKFCMGTTGYKALWDRFDSITEKHGIKK